MKSNFIKLGVIALGLLLAACKKDSEPTPTGTSSAVVIKGNTDTTQKYSGSYITGVVNEVDFEFKDGTAACFLTSNNESAKITETKYVSSYGALLKFTDKSTHFFKFELDSVNSTMLDDREALKSVFKVGLDTLNKKGTKLNLKYYRAGVVYSSHLSDLNVVNITKVENVTGKVFYNKDGAQPKTNGIRVTGKIDSALLTDFNSLTGKTENSIYVKNINFCIVLTTVNDESKY